MGTALNSSFKIQCEWLPDDCRNPQYQVDRVELSILVNGKCATMVEDSLDHSIRKVVRVSALHLSEWIAGNWWRLRWEPETVPSTLDWHMSHDLASAGGGYIWPSLSFSSDSENVLVCSRPSQSQAVEPIRYLQDFNEVITAHDFEQGVDDFINATIERLPDAVKEQTVLLELWSEIARERSQPNLRELRKLEAFLGHDPEEAPADFIEGLQSQTGRFGAGAVQEVAAASKDRTLDHLLSLGEGIQNSGTEVCVSHYEVIRQQYQQQTNPSDRPWQRAEQTAQNARSTWALDPGPVSTETLAELFGIDVAKSSADKVPLSAGLCDDIAEDRFRVALNQNYLTGRRFALSRLVADHFVKMQGESLLPATRAKTSRQKFQRAFASEFLCPFKDLRDFLGELPPDDENIDYAAEHFEVSPLVIRSNLVNKEVLGREALGE